MTILDPAWAGALDRPGPAAPPLALPLEGFDIHPDAGTPLVVSTPLPDAALVPNHTGSPPVTVNPGDLREEFPALQPQGPTIMESRSTRSPEVEMVNGRWPINSGYAEQTYPATNFPVDLQAKYPDGVVFTPQGYPDFTKYAKASVDVAGLTGINSIDDALANKAVGLSATPQGYTWHHVENGTTMQLLPSDLHEAVRHTGGRANIKQAGGQE